LAYIFNTKIQYGVKKWPPTPPNDRKFKTIDSNLMILMYIPRFLGARNTLRPLQIKVGHYLTG